MNNKAFVIANGEASHIANDECDFRYRAARHCLPVGVQAAAQTNTQAETQFMVEDGIVEFMIGGATAMVLAGDFVRVPPGVVHAYRNAGDSAAHLLVRRTSPQPTRRALRLSFAA